MVFIWNRLVILKLIWLSLLLPRVCKFWSDHIFLRAVLTHSMHDCLRMIPVFKGTKLTLFPCSSYLSSAANVRHYQLILHALFGFHQNVAALLCSSLCIKVLRGFVLLFVWCWLVEAGWLLLFVWCCLVEAGWLLLFVRCWLVEAGWLPTVICVVLLLVWCWLVEAGWLLTVICVVLLFVWCWLVEAGWLLTVICVVLTDGSWLVADCYLCGADWW